MPYENLLAKAYRTANVLIIRGKDAGAFTSRKAERPPVQFDKLRLASAVKRELYERRSVGTVSRGNSPCSRGYAGAGPLRIRVLGGSTRRSGRSGGGAFRCHTKP